MAKIVTVDKLGRLDLEDFRELVNVDRIEFYSLKVKKDKTLILKFYDKKKRLVKPNGQK